MYHRNEKPKGEQRCGVRAKHRSQRNRTGRRLHNGRYHYPKHDAGANGKAQDACRLVPIDLRLVEIDEIENRDQHGCAEQCSGHQSGHVEQEYAGQPCCQRPAELMQLLVTKVRK